MGKSDIISIPGGAALQKSTNGQSYFEHEKANKFARRAGVTRPLQVGDEIFNVCVETKLNIIEHNYNRESITITITTADRELRFECTTWAGKSAMEYAMNVHETSANLRGKIGRSAKKLVGAQGSGLRTIGSEQYIEKSHQQILDKVVDYLLNNEPTTAAVENVRLSRMEDVLKVICQQD